MPQDSVKMMHGKGRELLFECDIEIIDLGAGQFFDRTFTESRHYVIPQQFLISLQCPPIDQTTSAKPTALARRPRRKAIS